MDKWIYKVAEVLDARVYKTLSVIEIKDALKLIKQFMCSFAETEIKATATVLDDLTSAFGAAPTAAMQSPIDLELCTYISMMHNYIPTNDNFYFWQANKATFPILYTKARFILGMSACSSDVERLFSATGNICTPKKNRLSPAHLENIVMLRHWMQYERYGDTRSASRLSSIYKYCKVNTDLVVDSDPFDNVLEQIETDEVQAVFQDELEAETERREILELLTYELDEDINEGNTNNTIINNTLFDLTTTDGDNGINDSSPSHLNTGSSGYIFEISPNNLSNIITSSGTGSISNTDANRSAIPDISFNAQVNIAIDNSAVSEGTTSNAEIRLISPVVIHSSRKRNRHVAGFADKLMLCHCGSCSESGEIAAFTKCRRCNMYILTNHYSSHDCM